MYSVLFSPGPSYIVPSTVLVVPHLVGQVVAQGCVYGTRHMCLRASLVFVLILHLLTAGSSKHMSVKVFKDKGISEVIGDYTTFLSDGIDRLRTNGINIVEDTENFKEIDHICYRVSSKQNYDIKKNELTKFGVKIIESVIGNRPISVFMLFEPLSYDRFQISLIELPSPKSSSQYNDGLEHFEIVVVGNEFSISDMKEKEYLEKWSSSKFPQINFDTRALDKDINCDLALPLSSTTSCKFHCFSLNEIIAYEKDNNLTELIP